MSYTENHDMKSKLFILFFLFSFYHLKGQVEVTLGPEVGNASNSYLNRIIQGDGNAIYSYRVKTKGGGFSYFIEKYEKETMKLLFLKEIKSEQNQNVNVENVFYTSGNVMVFISHFYKERNLMSLCYSSVSQTGELVFENVELLNVQSNDRELVDFDLSLNPDKTKVLIKVCYAASEKDFFKTDFVLYETMSMKQLFKKQVDKSLPSKVFIRTTASSKVPVKNRDFHELMLDKEDNIYYVYSTKMQGEQARYSLAIDIIPAASNSVISHQLDITDLFRVEDLYIIKNGDKEIVVAGFVKEQEKKTGFDLLRLGLFNFTVNLSDYSIINRELMTFNDSMLNALRVTPKLSHFFKYKMDYAYAVGSDIYFIGEQYARGPYGATRNNPDGPLVNPNDNTEPFYNYNDVIVAKLNSAGKWEWTKVIPLRFKFDQMDPYVSTQYIAYLASKSICILHNDKKGNLKVFDKPVLELEHLGNTKKSKGSDFVCREISLSDGKIKSSVVFSNDNYCFDPIPSLDYTGSFPPYSERKLYYSSSDADLFINGAKNEIYIYTQTTLKGRFVKLKFN